MTSHSSNKEPLFHCKRSLLLTSIILSFATLSTSCQSETSIKASSVTRKESTPVTTDEPANSLYGKKPPSDSEENSLSQNMPLKAPDFTKIFEINCLAIIAPTVFRSEDTSIPLMAGDETFLSQTALIPDNFCDIVIDTLAKNDIINTFSSMLVSTEISQEAFYNKIGDNRDVEPVDLLPVTVDGDNDGIEDIACQIFYGGSGGFASFYFYQGKEDGSYEEPFIFDTFLKEFGFLQHEEKNYLVQTDFDYYTKSISGFNIFLYDDGVISDMLDINYTPTKYLDSILITDKSAPTDQLLQTLEQIDFNTFPQSFVDNDYKIVGTVEHNSNVTGYHYSCDLNNDGILEHYNKNMFYPTNMTTELTGEYDFKDGNSYMIDSIIKTIYEDPSSNGNYYTFWVDKIDDDNIIFCYFGNTSDTNNGYDYTIYGFKVT